MLFLFAAFCDDRAQAKGAAALACSLPLLLYFIGRPGGPSGSTLEAGMLLKDLLLSSGLVSVATQVAAKDCGQLALTERW